jgi:hypothetical protein
MPDDARPQPKAQPDAQGRDDVQPSIDTVIDGLASRSDAERGALLKALLDGRCRAVLAAYAASSTGDDVMPLPGIEASIAEKAGQNSPPIEDSNFTPWRGPLPGTTSPQGDETTRKADNSVSYTPDPVRGMGQTPSWAGRSIGFAKNQQAASVFVAPTPKPSEIFCRRPDSRAFACQRR